MKSFDEDMHSFVVRLWLEPREIDNAAPVWRGVIEHVTTGRRQYMNNLEQIRSFIESYLPEMKKNKHRCRMEGSAHISSTNT